MTALVLSLGSDDDDAYENQNGNTFNASAGYIYSSSSTSTLSRYNGGLVYKNVTIPQGATIDSATIAATCTTTSFDDILHTIGAEDVDDAVDFGSNADVTTRTSSATTAGVEWRVHGAGTSEVTSPDIKTVIQEIVDRAGWVSGNAMCILLMGQAGEFEDCRFVDYGADPDVAPKLTINYTAASTSASGKLTLLNVG